MEYRQLTIQPHMVDVRDTNTRYNSGFRVMKVEFYMDFA